MNRLDLLCQATAMALPLRAAAGSSSSNQKTLQSVPHAKSTKRRHHHPIPSNINSKHFKAQEKAPLRFLSTKQLSVGINTPSRTTTSPSKKSAPLPASNNMGTTNPHKELVRENVRLKIELGQARMEVAKLQKKLKPSSTGCATTKGNLAKARPSTVSKSVGLAPLRPTKVSEIPIADMISIMNEFGSEVSGQASATIIGHKKAPSVVRQFRRWNPNFFQYFDYTKDNKWIPKLGKARELQRRKVKRAALLQHRRNPPPFTTMAS